MRSLLAILILVLLCVGLGNRAETALPLSELPPVPVAPPAKKKVRVQAASQGAGAAQLVAKALPVQTSKPIVVEWYWTPRTNCAYLVQRSTTLTNWQTVTGYSKAAGTWKTPMVFRFTNSLTAENFRLREIYLGHEDLKKL